MSEKITARTKAEFMAKVKEALKKEYAPNSTVDLKAFGEKYGIRPSNVKAAIEEMQPEGEGHYALLLPAVPVRVKPEEGAR
jgi:hypothetical protein